MQLSKLISFSCFALAATVSASSPPVITPTVSFTPLPPCTLGGDASCSSGSVCTPAGICIGQCYSGVSSPTILPTNNHPITATTSVNTCHIGFPSDENGCSSGSYCLPTTPCPGLCLNTVVPPPPTTTTVSLTTYSNPPPPPSCAYNEFDSTSGCPPSSECTPVATCYGVCSTTTSPYAIGTQCIVLGGDCAAGATCSQTASCAGACIGIPPTTITDTYITPSTTHKTTPKPTSTSATCGWVHRVYVPCATGYKCVNQQGQNCGVGQSGHCVPVHQKKHRFLAGRYFNEAEE